MQDVSHLLAVTINGDIATEQRGNHKPGNPTLILHAKLACSVDARLPERGSRNLVDSSEIKNVLIGSAL
jgi:hypothetical protein